jgi:hypothetical protein
MCRFLPSEVGTFFVMRIKSNFNARRVYSTTVNKNTGVKTQLQPDVTQLILFLF